MADIYRKTVLAAFLILLASTASASMQEANQSLQQAQQSIQEMEELNLSTQRVGDLYTSAQKSFKAQQQIQQPDYTSATEDAETVVELKQQAIQIYDNLQAFNETLVQAENRYSTDLGEVRNSFNQASEDLKNERYSEAEQHLEDARRQLSEARSAVNRAQAFYSAATNDFVQYVRQNPVKLGTASAATLLLLLVVANEFRYLKASKRTQNLENKKEVVEQLMKESEKAYYVERELDSQSFEARNKRYSQMLTDIQEKLPVHRQKMQDKKSLIKTVSGLDRLLSQQKQSSGEQ